MGIYVAVSDFLIYQITKYQFNRAQVYKSCGVFDHYNEVNESRSGRIELITTYININNDTGTTYIFMHHGRLHKNILNLKKLQTGDKVCFEYIKPYFKKYGENFIKSIQLK